MKAMLLAMILAPALCAADTLVKTDRGYQGRNITITKTDYGYSVTRRDGRVTLIRQTDRGYSMTRAGSNEDLRSFFKAAHNPRR